MRKHLLSALLAVCLVATAFAQQGKVYETRTVKSEILGMERSYSIYLPAGYEEGDGSYPVLYLLHGLGDNHTGWIQFGQVQYIADKAIAEGKSAPMIIVMPDADTVHKGYFNLLDGTYNYEDFFFKELIPHIEKTYRVRAESRYRAISGLSMGGGGALFLCASLSGDVRCCCSVECCWRGMDIRSNEESIGFIEGIGRKESGNSRTNGYTNYLGEIPERKVRPHQMDSLVYQLW